MPIYTYKCKNEHLIETVQSINEPALKTCPQCQAPTERVLHPPTIRFHGAGFHNTDYGVKTRASK